MNKSKYFIFIRLSNIYKLINIFIYYLFNIYFINIFTPVFEKSLITFQKLRGYFIVYSEANLNIYIKIWRPIPIYILESCA